MFRKWIEVNWQSFFFRGILNLTTNSLCHFVYGQRSIFTLLTNSPTDSVDLHKFSYLVHTLLEGDKKKTYQVYLSFVEFSEMRKQTG